MKVVAMAVLAAGLVTLVTADLEDKLTEGIGDVIKGVGKKLGVDVCDIGHATAGVPFCPGPGMSEEIKYCCTSLTGEPACCSWVENNLKILLIAAGVAVLLILIGCCCCCYCCCCRSKSQQGTVIVMQSPPAQYPNHPHAKFENQVSYVT